jgi:hypothetical protein
VYSDFNQKATDILHNLWTPYTIILQFLNTSPLLAILVYGWINNIMSCQRSSHFVYSARPTSNEQVL